MMQLAIYHPVHMRSFVFCLVCFLGLQIHNASAQVDPSSLPLFDMEDMTYAGAFRLPADMFGASSLNYAEGPIAYHPANHSLFIVGHTHHQAIAEFKIPELIRSESLTDLQISDRPLQMFSSVLDRVSGGNPQAIDRIGGLICIETELGTEILVNAYEYYDAPADNSHSTFVIRDAFNLSNANIEGFFSMGDNAAHKSGWLSEIPEAWQATLGGTYITGHASGIPIIGRASVGPSAFVFDPYEVVGTSSSTSAITTSTLLDFSLDHPLHVDLSNDTRANGIWTHLSRAVYGFIVPGTRSYMTIGYSGGHASGVCYKCTQNNGNVCGGYCAPDTADYSLYYWLWDVNDLAAVLNSNIEAYSVLPYAYGPFETPFASPSNAIGGATFDAATGLLYMTIQQADGLQGEFNNPPVVAAYQVTNAIASVTTEQPAPITAIDGLTILLPYPNPVYSTSKVTIENGSPREINIALYDLLGRKVHHILDGHLPTGRHTFVIQKDNLPAGVYFLRIADSIQDQVMKLVFN